MTFFLASLDGGDHEDLGIGGASTNVLKGLTTKQIKKKSRKKSNCEEKRNGDEIPIPEEEKKLPMQFSSLNNEDCSPKIPRPSQDILFFHLQPQLLGRKNMTAIRLSLSASSAILRATKKPAQAAATSLFAHTAAPSKSCT